MKLDFIPEVGIKVVISNLQERMTQHKTTIVTITKIVGGSFFGYFEVVAHPGVRFDFTTGEALDSFKGDYKVISKFLD